ncbi:MAG: iron ABC transporter substrate-binding protein [Caldilineaceae bacterium]
MALFSMKAMSQVVALQATTVNTNPSRSSVSRWARGIALLVTLLLVVACQVAPQSAATTGTETPADAQEAATANDNTASSAQSLTIYSGRNENLVGSLIAQFEEESGIDVQVRYGDTAEMAATILEEGANSPADLFFGQDAGALGALALAGRLTTLPDDLLAMIEPRFRSPDGQWIGISGRARVLVYNTDELTEADLPASVNDLTAEEWRGRVGWAPSNGSFQSFVTAFRTLAGEEAAQAWLEAMIANDTQAYSNNTAVVTAVAAGEVSVGLVNHYYLSQFLAEQGESFPARNYYFPAGDIGSMINVAGVGILDTSTNMAVAEQFIQFLLSTEAQQYFATETNEYPLTGEGIEVNSLLKPLDEIASPDLDLSDLADLQGTLEMLQEVGALE